LTQSASGSGSRRAIDPTAPSQRTPCPEIAPWRNWKPSYTGTPPSETTILVSCSAFKGGPSFQGRRPTGRYLVRRCRCRWRSGSTSAPREQPPGWRSLNSKFSRHGGDQSRAGSRPPADRTFSAYGRFVPRRHSWTCKAKTATFTPVGNPGSGPWSLSRASRSRQEKVTRGGNHRPTGTLGPCHRPQSSGRTPRPGPGAGRHDQENRVGSQRSPGRPRVSRIRDVVGDRPCSPFEPGAPGGPPPPASGTRLFRVQPRFRTSSFLPRQQARIRSRRSG